MTIYTGDFEAKEFPEPEVSSIFDPKLDGIESIEDRRELARILAIGRNECGDIEVMRRLILFRDWLTDIGVDRTIQSWYDSHHLVDLNDDTRIIHPNIR